MSLSLLYFDEMKGFYKSKIMILLWIGLPILSIIMHYINPDTEGFPLTNLVGLLIGSIGGTLSSVMLSTSIASEQNKQVYDLFLIRPVHRYEILIAKFFAVYTCLLIATLISVIFGILIDLFTIGVPSSYFLESAFEGISISLSAIAIACSTGIIIGISVNSVAAAAILSVYVGNQLSMISVLPSIFLSDIINPVLFSSIVGIILSVGLLLIAISIFRKKNI